MAKNLFVSILVCVLFLGTTSSVYFNRVDSVALTQVGVREATGKNDGKEVEMYQKVTGNKRGDSWCASFIAWVFKVCKVRNTINGWAPSAQNLRNPIYYKERFVQEPIPGDVFSIWSAKNKRITHVGFYHRFYNARIYETIEGNTNINGSSNGNGVYKRKRSYNSTYSITRWP